MSKFEIIAFDADDTLWDNEPIYREVQAKYVSLLEPYAAPEVVDERLFRKEMSNLKDYGYGIKSFTLSMIETAVDLSEGRIPGSEIQKIVNFAREMLNHKVQLLDHVSQVVQDLSRSETLMLLTKGDLLDQEAKLARSGLTSFFHYFEVVSTKDKDTYQRLFEQYRIAPQRFLMIGNSLKSDVLPVLELGGYGVYIPYHTTWEHEIVKEDSNGSRERCFELEHIGQLPDLLQQINQG